MKNFIYLFLFVFVIGCSSEPSQNSFKNESNPELVEGSWTLHFNLSNQNVAPTKFNLSKVGDKYHIEFVNGAEKIAIKSVEIDKNKITIKDPIFNTWFEGEIVNESKIKGNWFKNDKNYKIAFEAKHSAGSRFEKPKILKGSEVNLSGRWEVDFSKNNAADHYKSIGQFNQDGNYLTGTFMTETGDYRFLEGNVYNDSLFLSCFDGAHLFLFKAIYKNDSLYGKFWSGTHWEEPWVAGRNENFELTNPDSLTYLKDGYEKLAFTFPSISVDSISLDDEKYQGKVVIVNIMGPWCPNCKDETAYLTSLYNLHHENGLEIIALSFVKSDDFEVAKETLVRIKKHFGANYDFAVAGKASKIDAAKALPMLNHIMSYPTTIFIDRKGNIRKIRTGFYGPGTGEFYNRYTEQTDSFITKLLSENN